MVDQDQAQDDEHAHVDDQAQVEGQVKDQNSGDDQVASQETFEEAQAHRARKVEDVLRKGSHTMDSVIGSVRKGVSTRRQLANFSSHHAFIPCVEPQKVFEALEDLIGWNLCTKNSTTSSATKFGHWWRSPKIVATSSEPNGCSRTNKTRMGLL
jgi:hypothetical protein